MSTTTFRKKFLIFLTCQTFTLLSTGCAYPLSLSEPISVDNQPMKIVLPITLEPTPIKNLDENTYRLLIPCTIETQQGLCLFDTGASGIILSSCLAETTSRFVGEGKGTVVASGEIHQLPTRKIRRLIIGNALHQDVLADLDTREECSKHLALIGNDLFKRQFFIDSDNLTLSEDNPRIELNQKLERIGTLLVVQILLDGTPVRALVDSGAEISIVDTSVFKDVVPSTANLNKQKYKVKDAHGKPMLVNEVSYSHLSIAGNVLDQVFLSSIDLAPLSKALGSRIEMIIGMNTIKMLNWGFDFEKGMWGVTPLQKNIKR